MENSGSNFLCLQLDDGRSSHRPILAQTDWTIEQLYQHVASFDGVPSDSRFFTLYSRGMPLCMDRMISDYDFCRLDTILVAPKMQYLTDNEQPTHDSSCQDTEGIELTIEPCCVSLDDSAGNRRARMPCGCPIGKDSVRHMMNTALENRQWNIDCPGCNKKSDFVELRKLLSWAFTPEELTEINKTVDDNFIGHPQNNIRQCGTCGTYSQRDFTKNWHRNIHRAHCYTCSKRAGQRVEFCWYCGQQWKSRNSKSCGNTTCAGSEGTLKILSACKTKTIGLLAGVPDTRACPRCGALIKHTYGCKHMNCTTCRCQFCFVCLKTTNWIGRWQCGSSDSACPIAARQTKIPGAGDAEPAPTSWCCVM